MPTTAEAALTQPDPCPYCAQPTGQGCVTLLGRVPTKPHGKRLTLGRVFLAGAASRDGEVLSVQNSAVLFAAERDEARADLTAEQAARGVDRDVAARLVADLRVQIAALTPQATMKVGMNISPGSSFTDGADETATQQAQRVAKTYGGLPVGKFFYTPAQGFRSTFNAAGEGVVGGKDVYVSFRGNQTDIAAGKHDDDLRTYCASVPEGWVVRLINWQEPSKPIWVDKTMPLALHRDAGDRMYDVVHATAAGKAGRVTLGDCFMEYDLLSGRWVDAAVVRPDGTSKRDFLGFDAYWNSPKEAAVHPRQRIQNMAAVAKRCGIPAWAILETGDNPDTFKDGAWRADFWSAVLDESEKAGAEAVVYFNAIGTTGDHRLLPGQVYSDPTIKVLAARMKAP